MKTTYWMIAASGMFLLATSLDVPSVAHAQSGTRSGGGTGSGVRRGVPQRQQQTFEQKFWSYLKSARYTEWAPVPGQTTGFYEGQSPHGAQLKTYVNRTFFDQPEAPPHGSIVIKENYMPDKQLAAITVMYRVKDYDPENNDWYWVKYDADGTVALTPPEKGSKPIAGRFQSCIECHQSAEGDDFLFTN